MRRLLAFLLLTSAAAPTLAAGDPGDRQGRHRESGTQSAAEDRGDRPARSERVQVDRGDRGGDDGHQAQPVVQLDRGNRGGSDSHASQPVDHAQSNNDGGQSGEHRFHGRFGNGGQGPQVQVQSSGGGGEPLVQRVRRGDGGSSETLRIGHGPRIVEPPQVTIEDRSAPVLRQHTRPLPRVLRDRVPIVSNTPREGTQPPHRTENRRSNWASWSTSHWRRDHRYNWQDHRRRHRSLFHLGFYYDPFGWGYRPYQIGWRLWPSYYSSNFWLNDPGRYRLPYAPPGYRWIRYYDDAILVDTWNGEVVDVIYNFFW